MARGRPSDDDSHQMAGPNHLNRQDDCDAEMDRSKSDRSSFYSSISSSPNSDESDPNSGRSDEYSTFEDVDDDDSEQSSIDETLSSQRRPTHLFSRSHRVFDYSLISSFVRRRRPTLDRKSSHNLVNYRSNNNYSYSQESEANDKDGGYSNGKHQQILGTIDHYFISSHRRLVHPAIHIRKRSKMRWCHWSTVLLLFATLIWSIVQFLCYTEWISRQSLHFLPALYNPLITYRIVESRTNQRRTNKLLPSRLQGKPKLDKEALLPGCGYSKWQRQQGAALLQCNALHELDLKLLLGESFPRHPKRVHLNLTQPNHTTGMQRNNSNDIASFGTYLSSGLWRDVWSLTLYPDLLLLEQTQHSVNKSATAVLKMMKMEHDVVPRNLERHRREAVTMDRLGGSVHVVDLFAYCGNTILSEFASQDLATALKSQSSKRMSTKKKKVTEAESVEEFQSSTYTVSVRLDMALQAAIGVHALHENDIIHADLTTQQFLVTSTPERPLLLKVNDFNRCRFIPHIMMISNSSVVGDQSCPIRIPSAPGLYRSPEEYSGQNLTERIDIFSLGHVLFEIWTGKQPWEDTGGKRIRQRVQEGHIPKGVEELLQSGKETMDANHLNRLIGRLIAECYRVDPTERISARDLVRELSQIIQEHT